jgi:phospholipase C
MNAPYPDPGEEYPHINTQLFGHIDPPRNRGVPAEQMVARRTTRRPGQASCR